ncbi:MAG TPA: bifunctional DNA primase/polymerase, partial [Gemmataceae bacterium]
MPPSVNGKLPPTAREAAAFYLERGFVPVPVPRTGRCKAPVIDGWQHLRPGRDDLPGLFPDGEELNLGLLLGEPSGGLIDIDLDCPEAVAAAPILLPPTGWVSGREGRPRSHWWYRAPPPLRYATEKFADLDAE